MGSSMAHSHPWKNVSTLSLRADRAHHSVARRTTKSASPCNGGIASHLLRTFVPRNRRFAQLARDVRGECSVGFEQREVRLERPPISQTIDGLQEKRRNRAATD